MTFVLKFCYNKKEPPTLKKPSIDRGIEK